jgi:hypothetical protein
LLIIEAAPERIVVRISEVAKRLELAPEEPISEATFAPADLVSAWQSPMFGNPVHGAVGEHSMRRYNSWSAATLPALRSTESLDFTRTGHPSPRANFTEAAAARLRSGASAGLQPARHDFPRLCHNFALKQALNTGHGIA